jgi:AcrR family transcriptional regulator
MLESRLRKDVLRNREAILGAAEKLLSDDANVSYAEIALAAGVHQATLYRHFSDRQEILVALMERNLDRTEGLVRTWTVGADSFQDLLRLMAIEQARHPSVMAAIRRGEVEEGRLKRLSQRTRSIYREPLAEAQKAGKVRREFQLDGVIPLLGMISGALSFESNRADRERAALEVVEILLRGIQPT